jgi:glycosyltransferase involved in cell wall biosynthesis
MQLKKIVVIDHVGNQGGGSRFSRALLLAMKKCQPDLNITYFGNPLSIERENLREEFENSNIKVETLKSCSLTKIKAIRKLREKLAVNPEKYSHYPHSLTGFVHQELERRIVDYDVALFTWPFFLECPKLRCPMIGVFHDFNYKYFFGMNIISPSQTDIVERQVSSWLERVTPIVTSKFMAKELAKFYPHHADKARLIHSAPLILPSTVSREEAQKIVADMEVQQPYILYPTHMCIHKNIGPLMAAIAILNQTGHKINLVLTGQSTNLIYGHACQNGLERIDKEINIQGLGYVSNEQIDALIDCAKVVVSSSLYEAGNGPGGDAWARGIPVAMSNIPPFLEHIELEDVRAQVFDPRVPEDIASKIAVILNDYEKAKADALYSQQTFQQHLSWSKTASEYLNVCNEMAEKRTGNSVN